MQRARRRGDGAVVQIDADEIQRGAGHFHVAGFDTHQGLGQEGEGIGIAAAQYRIEKPYVHDGVGPFGSQFVGRRVAGGFARRHVHDGTDTRLGTHGLESAKALALGEIHYMRGAQEVQYALSAGRHRSFQVAQVDKRGRLVEQDPIVHAITQSPRHELYVIAIAAHEIAIGPASSVFERLRHVPMIKRHQRPELRFQQCVHKLAVVVDSLGVRCAGTARLNSGP